MVTLVCQMYNYLLLKHKNNSSNINDDKINEIVSNINYVNYDI